MSGRNVSIYDIARIAGVSTATVSNVLNDKGRVSEETRARVLDISEREGYVPNFAAKSLREARTRMIGIITPDVSNYFYSSIALELETFFTGHGYTCCICNTYNRDDLLEGAIRNLAQRQVDGLLFVGGSSRATRLDLSGGVPEVYIDHRFDVSDPPCLVVDNDMAAMVRDATSLLLERGCSHVAILTVRAMDLHAARNGPHADQAASVRGGAYCVDDYVILVGPHHQPSLVESEQLVGDHLDAGNELDGIVAIGDRLALGALNALRARGIGVGDEVKIVSIDNSLLARIPSPTLTSIERHVDQLGLRGAEALLEMLENGTRSTGKIVIPHEIMERESTLGRQP